MKILLLGEYSGFHSNLKDGLSYLNCEVKFYHNGDSWKKIPSGDGVLQHPFKYRAQKPYYRFVDTSRIANNFRSYDVVQLINPMIYSPFINTHILKKIKKNNNKLFICAVGYDYYLKLAYKEKKFRYYMLDGVPENNSIRSKIVSHIGDISQKKVIEISDGIIPSTWEYYMPYEGKKNLTNIIPFPLNCQKIQYSDNIIKGNKLVLFHGVSRPKEKGSKYIIKAMKMVKDKYPDDVKIIVAEKLPYTEYLEALKEANVVLDQCLSYGYGYNALISMAEGKIVMSGAEPETVNAFGLNSVPVFNIQPNVNQIYHQLEFLLEERKELTRIGYEARRYVEEFHDCRRVAQMYIDTWKGYNYSNQL